MKNMVGIQDQATEQSPAICFGKLGGRDSTSVAVPPSTGIVTMFVRGNVLRETKREIFIYSRALGHTGVKIQIY